MSGALLQLQAKGIQDLFTTSAIDTSTQKVLKPVVNPFAFNVQRYVPFAQDIVKVDANEVPRFGKQFSFNLPKNGDYLTNTVLMLKLPKLVATSGSYACWTDATGLAIFDDLALEVNGQVVEKMTDIYMDILDELTTTDAHRSCRSLMINKAQTYSAVWENARTELTLTIPLDFFFQQHPGLALPLFALTRTSFRILCRFKKFEDSIHFDGPTGPDHTEIVDCFLLATSNYVHPDFKELPTSPFKNMNFSHIISQMQSAPPVDIAAGTKSITARYKLHHTCKELMFALVDNESFENNDYFNYSRREDNQSLITHAGLSFDGMKRFEELDEVCWRLKSAYETHTRPSDKYIYVIPFSADTESKQPQGGVNLSQFQEIELFIRLRPENPACVLHLFASVYNVVTIGGGLISVEFVVT